MRSFADGNGDGTGDLAGVRARARLPARPRRRRHLVHPVVPLAARRRRLRRRRLPRHRPGLRHPRRGRDADRRGARPRHPHDHRHRPQPRVRPARLVPGGARGGPGLAGARALLVPARPRRRTATSRPTTGRREFRAARTWTRTKNPDGTPGEWYLHLFAPEQPDLNWDHPDVRAEHEAILRFWFDRGAAGVRIDSAALLRQGPGAARDPGGRPHPAATTRTRPRRAPRHLPRLARDRRQLPGAARAGRRGLAGGPRALRPLPPPGRAAHAPSTSTSWPAPGTPPRLRASIDDTLAATPRSARRRRGCCRTTTSPGRSPATAATDTSFAFAASASGRRPTSTSARAGPAPRRCSSPPCPGSLYVYQGDELGLAEVEDLRPSEIQDPMHVRSGGIDPGRDGCRVPAAVERRRAAVRVQPGGRDGAPWLSQPAHWADADRRAAGIATRRRMLRLYRAALALRRVGPGLGDGPLTWVPSGPDVLAFERGDGVRASPTCPAPRCRCRPRRRSCWPARTSRMVTFRPTRRSGCGRTPSRRAQRGGCPPTRAERRPATATRTTGRRRTSQTTHRGRDQRGAAMRSTNRRPASILTAFAVIAIVVAACGGTTATAAPQRRRRRRPRARPRPRPRARRRARARHDRRRRAPPGRDPGGRRRPVRADRPVPGEVPLDHGRARGVQLDGADVHRGPRRRHAARRLHDPVHRRQGADRQPPDRRHRRARPGARLRRQVQPQRPRQRPGRRRQDLRASRPPPTACR